jgi:hypothetical protein
VNWPLAGAAQVVMKTVPVAMLVLIAGLVALLGLFFGRSGRRYAEDVSLAALTAACAIAGGQPFKLPGCTGTSRRDRMPLG